MSLQAVKKTRILFLLDASSSMTLPWKDSLTRFEVASKLLSHIIDSVNAVNPEVEFAVRTYGTVHPAQEKNCTDTRLEVPFNFGNISQIKTRLKYIAPIGYSPIAYSLEQASFNELSEPKKYDYSIVFITDGGESCNGDVCISYSRFLASKISVKPYVIGLDKNENLSNYYRCMGNYLDVINEEDLPKAVNMIVESNRRIIAKDKKDLPIPPPEITEPVVKRNLSETDFLLPYYPLRVHRLSMLTVTPVNVKPKGVTWRWNFTEEKKPEVRRGELAFITLPDFTKKGVSITKVSPRNFKAKKRSATLHFAWDIPVDRNASEYGKLYINEMAIKSNAISKVKVNRIGTKKSLTFRINYEEEVVRDQLILTRMMTTEVPLKKNTASKVKPTLQGLKKKLTLHLFIEDPIIRMEAGALTLSPLKLNAENRVTNKSVKSYAVKKKPVKLFFTVPIDRDSIALVSLVPHELVISNSRKKPVVSTAKTYVVKKKPVKLYFTVPIDRDSFVLVTLDPHEWVVTSTGKKPVVTASTAKAKSRKATLYFTVDVPKKDTMNDLRVRPYPKKISYALSLPHSLPIRLKSKPTLHFTFDVPATTAKSKHKLSKGDMDFTVKTEASAETTLQIYLKGEDGTMFPEATPKIEMVDTLTKDTIRFSRNVAGGSPKKEKIKPGVYDIFIREYNVARSYGVEIRANSNNEVTLNLMRGTLYFAYSNDIHKKVNYHALVKKRFAEKLVVRQSCADVLKYDPGTYYVEITDMLPPFTAIVYIDFFVDYLVSIPEPGTVEFTNTTPLGKVILQTTLGDGFANFYEMNINGNPETQKVTLRHGVYRAIIPVDPKVPMAGTKVVEFKVTSTKTTTLELK